MHTKIDTPYKLPLGNILYTFLSMLPKCFINTMLDVSLQAISN